MSDYEVASNFAFAAIRAEIAWTEGRRPRPTNTSGPVEDPVWVQLHNSLTPRLYDLVSAAGHVLPARNPNTTVCSVDDSLGAWLLELVPVAAKVADHFKHLEQDDPQTYARGSLRRLADEISRLRDENSRAFSYRVMRTFNVAGATQDLEPYFESATTLAQILGVPRPRAWRPNEISDWAGWHDEWERLRQFCIGAMEIEAKLSSVAPVVVESAMPYISSGSLPKGCWKVVFDLGDTATTDKLNQLIQERNASGGRGTGKSKYEVNIAVLDDMEKARLDSQKEKLNDLAINKAKRRSRKKTSG